MKLPEFTAEASLYGPSESAIFGSEKLEIQEGQAVIPASRHCTDDGLLCIVCSRGHCGVEDSILGISRSFF